MTENPAFQWLAQERCLFLSLVFRAVGHSVGGLGFLYLVALLCMSVVCGVHPQIPLIDQYDCPSSTCRV